MCAGNYKEIIKSFWSRQDWWWYFNVNSLCSTSFFLHFLLAAWLIQVQRSAYFLCRLTRVTLNLVSHFLFTSGTLSCLIDIWTQIQVVYTSEYPSCIYYWFGIWVDSCQSHWCSYTIAWPCYWLLCGRCLTQH